MQGGLAANSMWEDGFATTMSAAVILCVVSGVGLVQFSGPCRFALAIVCVWYDPLFAFQGVGRHRAHVFHLRYVGGVTARSFKLP
jgi:hypothetical protein